MNTKILLVVFAIAISFSCLGYAQDYCLAPGDVIAMNVWGFNDLKVDTLVIRPDGKIDVPLAGEIAAAGLTMGELHRKVADAMAAYITNPQVTINIVKYHTTRVYVLGEVVKPGLYEIERQHNLLDAISFAGGCTKDAAKRKVLIIRKNDGSNPAKVNLLSIFEKGDMTQNYALSEGDTVFVGPNHRIDFTRDILPFITGAYYVKKLDDD